jgi:CO/xanthine dehydrogenase Mo-binding subunit
MKQDGAIATENSALSRRDFLKLSGTGLVVFFWAGPSGAWQQPQPQAPPPSTPTDFNAFLLIRPDGRVICSVGRIEMGQGPKTALAQLVAEELDVAYGSIDMVMVDTDVCPWDVGTFGSQSMRVLGPILRQAAAEARVVLLQMAAEQWKAPVERLQTSDAVITDPASGNRVTYAALVQGKRIERHVGKVPLKSPSAFKVIGTSPQRKDAVDKVIGKAKYAADITVPGMVYARILRPPAHGAKLKNVDTSAVAQISRAQVVRDGDFIAVICERPDLADKALALIKAEYERPQTGLDDKTIFEHLVKNAQPPKVMAESGSLAEAEKTANPVESTYLHSYGAHAAMETQSALAMIEGGKVTVWAASQIPFRLKDQVAQVTGISKENVRVIVPYVGGAFGGKTNVQNGVEAARLAKLVGKPVQLVWRRDEDFFYERFRPAAVVKIRSAVNDGRIVFWDYTVYAAGDWGSVTFYDVPNQKTVAVPVTATAWQKMDTAGGLHPFNVGPWRMPGVVTNTFARESQMDVLAAKAGVDPVEFRLQHLSDKRMRRVLETATKQFGWKAARAPTGRGVGIACGNSYKTYVATAVQAAVEKSTGKVRVERVVTAVDAGIIVDPEGTRQQVEGCTSMGIGCALSEEVHFSNGEIFTRNFDSYEIPRFSTMPKMEVVLIDNPELAPDGVAEPPVITVGAAIANAVYDATGARLFQLPMTPARIKQALGQS